MKLRMPIGLLVLVALTCTATYATPGVASTFGPFPESFGPGVFGVYQFGSRLEEQGGMADVRAGSHPYMFTTSVVFNHEVTNEVENYIKSPSKGLRAIESPEITANIFGSPKHLQVNLPPGVVVNPNATPVKCTEAQFETAMAAGGGCPEGSIVGVDVPLISKLYPPASVYDIVPPPGVAAEFGVNPGGIGFVVHIVGKVRTDGAYELAGEAENITPKIPVYGNELILWGDPTAESHDAYRGVCVSHVKVEKEVEEELVKLGRLSPANARYDCPLAPSERTDKPLLTMPGSCSTQLTSTLSTTSWQEPTHVVAPPEPNTSASSPAVTGCGELHFNPSLTIRPEAEGNSESAEFPSGLSADLHFPLENLEANEGLAEANLEQATVTLPAGFAVSPSSASGLGVCTPEEISLHSAAKPSCPDSSKVGDAEVTTPLLEHPLKGAVYVAQQDTFENSLIALYIVVEGQGALVKLGGKVSLDPGTGQVTATFANNPQLPFSELKLKFFPGPRAPLLTPATCGTYAGSTVLTPWSGNPPLEASTGSFSITSNCTHSFAPSMVAGSTNLQAGGYTPFSLTLSRRDGEQRFGGVSVTMPPGLLANLKSVPLCPEPQAAQGECSEASLVGETTASAGPGPDSVWVKGGKVYLTGPYDGAPFGLSIVVPAIAGPFNLGTVIARATINVDRNTAQAIVTGQIPTIKDGIPLDVRTINVTVNRPGFVFNPTNCTPTTLTALLESDTGTRTVTTNPFNVANCAALPFNPSFTASTPGQTSKANGAGLTVKVGSSTGQANIAKVRVALPKQLPARLSTLQKACTDKVFDTNPAACPPASAVGTATAITPVLAHPLTGPAYLVSHGGVAFPDLVFVLQGEGIVLYLDGNTNIKKGITTSTFNSVPDAPINSFQTVFPQGPTSVLATDIPTSAHNSMCSQKLTMPTTITAQNGAHTTQTTNIQITNCPKGKKAKKTAHRKKRGRSR